MKRRLFSLLLIIELATNAHGQMVNPCQIGQNKARQIISSGSIYFPRTIVESSFTLRKMVELDYGIKDEIYDNGTCLLEEDELECFYKLMNDEIENKWGKGFLKVQARIANKLDKEGMGYVKPKENGIKDSIIQYLKKEYPLKIDKVYLVAIKISADKEIIDVNVSSGAPRSIAISRDYGDYLLIKKAAQAIDKVYEPAYLRGKPIESLLIFWVRCD